MIRYIIRRDELGYRTLKRWSGAVFNRWLIYKSDNPKRQAQIEALYEALNVKSVFKRAYMLALADGYSLIALGWVETEQDPTKEPHGVTDIDYIHAIPKTAVQFIHQDLDPLSDKYGEITAYTIKQPTGGPDTITQGSPSPKIFPAARFLHFRNDFIDDDPTGISIFEPLYDKFTVKKNQDYAMGEVLMSSAKPFPVLTLPDDADDDEMDAADLQLDNIDVKSHFIKPKGYDLTFQGPTNVLNPKPYTDYTLSTLAAGSMGSKVALLGTEAGAVTGSEINIGEWYSSVADEQRNVVEPMLRAFNMRLEELGIIEKGKDTFDWVALYELDDKELAFVEWHKSTSMSNVGNTIVALQAVGWELFTEGEDIYFTRNGEVIQFLSAREIMKACPEITPPPLETTPGKPPLVAPKKAPAPGSMPPAVPDPGMPKGPPAPQMPEPYAQQPPNQPINPNPVKNPGSEPSQTPNPDGTVKVKSHTRSLPALAQRPIENRRPLLNDAQAKQLYGEWYEKTESLEGAFSDSWHTLTTVLEAQILSSLKKSWEKNIGPVGHVPPTGQDSYPIGGNYSDDQPRDEKGQWEGDGAPIHQTHIGHRSGDRANVGDVYYHKVHGWVRVTSVTEPAPYDEGQTRGYHRDRGFTQEMTLQKLSETEVAPYKLKEEIASLERQQRILQVPPSDERDRPAIEAERKDVREQLALLYEKALKNPIPTAKPVGGASIPGSNANTTIPDFAAILQDMNAWKPTGWNSFQKAFNAFIAKAYESGAEQTAQNMGETLDPANLQDTKTIKLLQASSDTLGRNTYLDTHQAAMREIAEGLKNQESYAQINDRIAGKFTEFSDGIPATVQKVVHEAACEARWDTMKELGADKGVFTTARDDRVRPTHAAMEGQVVTRDEAMPYLSDYGCRCTIIPLTIYDQWVADAQAGGSE